MALRLVGLAFEVNSEQGPVQGPIPGTSQQPSTSHTSAVKLTTSVSKQSEDHGKPVEPSAVDIISYSYFFIGLHKGKRGNNFCVNPRDQPSFTYDLACLKLYCKINGKKQNLTSTINSMLE